MKKTDIIDVIARKLSPYILLFGFYLVAFGHRTPGGGFQGGVVMASGVILLALGRDPSVAMTAFPPGQLSIAETVSYILLLALGLAGVAMGGFFLQNVLSPGSAIPRVGFVFALNIVIGIKVGAGVSLIALHLFREESR
ncbi:MAG: sodium:proton antiporter [Spirochaetes bacterium]|jgi:multicomponent Na+:H+ antiporter subunit B|nr:sodium:proton antiporter [Spirochaetota bacterium]